MTKNEMAHLCPFATGTSYIINKYWTFKKSNNDVRREFSKFVIVNLISLSIKLASMAILVKLYSIYPPIAQLLTIGVTVIVLSAC